MSHTASDQTRADSAVVKPADWFQNGFHRFLETYLRRHFHTIAIERESMHRLSKPDALHSVAELVGQADVPVVVYSNHPSWWDPLLAHYINRHLLSPRQFYAPIDAEALQSYKVFEKLGFFGLELDSKRGAGNFLRTTSALLQRPATALWLTPEGRFADVRDPVELMPGLAHLCHRLEKGLLIPLSLEYVFWEERLPECLFRVGDMTSIADHPQRDKQTWANQLQHDLRDNQAVLAELIIARSAEPFEPLTRGQQGARGVYDWSRRLKSWVTGKQFRASHGEKFE